MIIYKNNRNNSLIPVFVGVIMVLLNLVPLTTYFNAKTTNTDSLAALTVRAAISAISKPDKQTQPEIDVPALGNVSVKNAVFGPSENTKSRVSTCAATPTPAVNQISVCGRLIPIYTSDNYAGVSPNNGQAVKYTKKNFIFGHNSYDVFGGLHNLLSEGDPIIVNLGGVEETYYFRGYWLNTATDKNGNPVVDPAILQPNGSGTLGVMTCAPWVVNGAADASRYDFLFLK